MKLRLFPKFFLILTLLAVLPAIVVGWRTTIINKTGMQAAILELQTNLAASLADNVRSYLQELDREISYVNKTLAGQMAWSDRQAVLQTMLDSNENLVAISIVDSKGAELMKAYNPDLEKDPKLLSREQDLTFVKFWQSPTESSISDVYFAGQNPQINIVYPFSKQLCLYTTVSLKSLWNKIAGTKIASTGYGFLVDGKGRIIAHPKTELAIAKTNAMNLPIVGQVVKAVTVGSSEYQDPQTKKWMVGAYAPVTGLHWGVVIQQDKDEAYISVRQMTRQAILLVLISLFAAALLALFIARTLTNPLVALTHAARRVGQNDFNARITVKTHDELRDFAETFNAMTEALQVYDAMQVDKIAAEKIKNEALIYSIADGIIMTDKNDLVQLVNEPARLLLNLPNSDLQNKSIWDFVTAEPMKPALKEVIDNPAKNLVKEVDLSVSGMASFYSVSSQEVLTPEKNEKLGVVTVLHNITLERELDRMKDDFLHSITHDLRNPMTSIRGFLRFLIDGVAGPITAQQHKMLETIDRASSRLLNLINDILDVAKMESGRKALSLAPTDLKMLSQRVIEVAEGQAMRKNVKLLLEAPENLPLINADIELLERVLANLVGNALKFTPEEGSITIKLEDTGDIIQATVADTGEGIPTDYIGKIFDKYQQVAGQHKGGTGLGLTICRYIVESHNGRIWAESTVGSGSKFIFTLPKNLKQEVLKSEVHA